MENSTLFMKPCSLHAFKVGKLSSSEEWEHHSDNFSKESLELLAAMTAPPRLGRGRELNKPRPPFFLHDTELLWLNKQEKKWWAEPE